MKSVIDDLPLTSYPKTPLQTHIAPPLPGTIARPQAYVWGAALTETRDTAPRNYAFKSLLYEVNVNLIAAESANDPETSSRFPVLIDDVMAAYRATAMPVEIQDSYSGVSSQIVAVGEQFTVVYDTERTLENMRYVRMLAQVVVTVEEHIVA